MGMIIPLPPLKTQKENKLGHYPFNSKIYEGWCLNKVRMNNTIGEPEYMYDVRHREGLHNELNEEELSIMQQSVIYEFKEFETKQMLGNQELIESDIKLFTTAEKWRIVIGIIILTTPLIAYLLTAK